MDTQPQDQPVVGDDGELLQADPKASPIKYAEYVAQIPSAPAVAPTPAAPVDRLMRRGYVGCLFLLATLCGVIVLAAQTYQFVDNPNANRTIAHLIPMADGLQLPETGQALADDFGGQPLRDLSWSPDSSRIALLDTEESLLVCDYEQDRCLVAQDYAASFVAWSPRTQELLTVNGQHIGRRDPANYFKSLQTVYDGDGVGSIRYLRPSPDGRSLAALTRLNRLLILDFETGAVTLNQDISPSLSEVDWSPDSTGLIAVYDHVLWRWGAGAAETGPLDAEASASFSMARWSPDGKFILLSGEKRNGRLSTPFIQVMGIGIADQGMTLTPLAAVDLTDAEQKTSSPRYVGAEWSPDGAQLLAFVTGGKRLYRFRNDLGEKLETFDVPYSFGITAAHWSPDGRYIAFICETILVFWSPPPDG